MSNEFDGLIQATAAKHGVDPYLVKAIVATESSFNPRAYRAEPQVADASYGLMQVLLGTARWMGYTGSPEGLYDPETNVEYGVRYLRWLLSHFNGDLLKTISGYNTGPANVRQRSDGTFTNQAYVSRVLDFFRRLRPAAVAPAAGGGAITPVSPTEVRVAMGRSAQGDVAAALETFLPANVLPFVVAGVVAIGLAVLAGGSRSRAED